MKFRDYLRVFLLSLYYSALLCFKLLRWIFIHLQEAVLILINSHSPKKESFDAEFLPASRILSRWNKGFCLTGIGSTTEKDAHMHAMVLGGSGTGKSTVVILPTIYNMAKHGHSLCIHDPSGEIFQASAGYLESKGYTVKVLHFSQPELSDGYNPLERVKTNTDIYKTASVLVQNASGKSNQDAFWNNSAISFISLMIALLKHQEPQFQTMANVKNLIDSFLAEPEFMDLLVVKCHDEAILKEHKNFLKTEKKVMANIISTCRSSLMLFSDPAIQIVSSFDSINFQSFREEKTALFVMNKISDVGYYAPLTSTFFLQFFNHIMSSPVPGKEERSIFFLIDETASLYLPGTLQISLANLRKWRCGVMLVLQDFNQLIHLYGKPEAEAIRSNTFSKIYFPNQPFDTARELEVLLGKREYTDKEGHKHTRVLLTTDEIRSLHKKYALIFCGSNRAIHAFMLPFFKRHVYRTYAALPPPDMDRYLMPFDIVPILEPIRHEKPQEQETI